MRALIWSLILALILTMIACGPEAPRGRLDHSMPPAQCSATKPAETMIPIGAFGRRSAHGRDLSDAYVEILVAAGEPSLFCGASPGQESFRLTRLDWTGVPLTIRLDVSTDKASLIAVKLEAPTWNFPPG
jgi:hypothetical protein